MPYCVARPAKRSRSARTAPKIVIKLLRALRPSASLRDEIPRSHIFSVYFFAVSEFFPKFAENLHPS